MKLAIITLTRGALNLGKRLKEIIPEGELYTVYGRGRTVSFTGGDLYTLSPEAIMIEERLEDFVGNIFNKYDVILFIMAAGIVVRTIAKYIKDKSSDPAVLVMDEKGKFVISLLSGHIGGANEAAEFIAEKTGAQAVITTASDVLEKIAVDTLAMKLNCRIDNMEDAKNITSLIVNGYSVGIVSLIPLDISLPSNMFSLTENSSGKIAENIAGLICIDNRIRNFKIPSVQLIPVNIIIGAGCRKGVDKEQVIEACETALKDLKINKKSLKHFATADVKKDEEGLRGAAEYYGMELKIISREKIKKVEENFTSSEFVKKTIGVGSVCEPCAYLSSGRKGKFLMRKTKFKGVTLAIWEEEKSL